MGKLQGKESYLIYDIFPREEIVYGLNKKDTCLSLVLFGVVFGVVLGRRLYWIYEVE